jgi:hypothetical protein
LIGFHHFWLFSLPFGWQPTVITGEISMKSSLRALAIAAIATWGGAAYAGPAWEFESAGTRYTNGTWDFAQAFSVNTNVTATGLDYADPITGNVDGNPVALYECDDADCTTTGSLLATATVTNIFAEFGHFRYVTIAPIALLAGHSYEIAGVSNQDNYTWPIRASPSIRRSASSH